MKIFKILKILELRKGMLVDRIGNFAPFPIHSAPIKAKLAQIGDKGKASPFFDTSKYAYFWIYSQDVIFAFFGKYHLNRFQFMFSWSQLMRYVTHQHRFVWGEGAIYLRGLFIVFFIDALITDDEPLWEPVEWSLIQTWLLFIFIFAWIGENLIASRFGSYTGRDKRVWFAWYKTFWLIEGWYAISYGLTALFVIVPFYYELTYQISFVISWWNWYSRIFFFKFISFFALCLSGAQLLLITNRSVHWSKLCIVIGLINFGLLYFLFLQFLLVFFSYSTDPVWYQKTRYNEYIQLSHEPLKWGWGGERRDHFTYHKIPASVWFKNETPFASAFLLFQLFFLLSVFLLALFWLTLFRRSFSTEEISFSFLTYCVSALRQFLFCFLLLYMLICVSYVGNYWRFPIEFLVFSSSDSWVIHLASILLSYPELVFAACAN